MASYAIWKVGVINSPGSTGTQAVTGLGGTPDAVFFYGTNWTTEDSVVTSGHCGMFRGMAAPRYTDAALIQQAVTNTPVGDQTGLDNVAIFMHSTAGTATTLYKASVSSLDSGGFTLNWSTAASGYKIIYIALMDVDNCRAGISTYNTTFTSFGFKAGSSLLHGHRGSGPFSSGTNTQGWYGGAAYPGTSSGGWQSASVTNATFPDASGQRYVHLDVNDPTIITVAGIDNTGAFMHVNNLKVYPSGTGQADLTFTGMSGDAGNYGMVVAWDDEDSWGLFNTPASSVSATSTTSGLSFAPGLLLGYTISDVEPGGGSPLGTGALGFAIITPDFQWCAVSDDNSAYQSFSLGFADTVNGSNVHGGTVALTDDGFVLTTTIADTSAHTMAWHAFGHPQVAAWIPQTRRWMVGP